MFIQTQDTPNPSTMKFLPGQEILPHGTLAMTTREQAQKMSPLAFRLFGLTGVVSVFLAKEFVSVTKADNTDWSMLKPMILAVMMEHLSTAQPIINVAALNQGVFEEENEIIIQIKELLETRVRPMVAQDGGDIVFDRFEEGVVFLHLQGACAGCPSSTATLKMGIENMLRHYIPEVLEVRATN